MDVFNYLCNVFSFYLKQNDNDKTIFGHYRVVAIVEKFYDILERIHSLESGHVEYKKTLAESMSVAFGLYQGGPPLPVFGQGGPSPHLYLAYHKGTRGNPLCRIWPIPRGTPPGASAWLMESPFPKSSTQACRSNSNST